MSDTETMIKLHERAAGGETLSATEAASLGEWYATLDAEEDALLAGDKTIAPTSDLALQSQIKQTTESVARVSREVKDLTKQNKALQDENRKLRRKLEARLAEHQAA